MAPHTATRLTVVVTPAGNRNVACNGPLPPGGPPTIPRVG
jgi:hypothetical protein